MGENHDNTTQWVPLNLNLMIIDEDPTNLKYITAALKACHFGVVSFGNPIEALVQLCVGDKKYDLVLVDLNCTKLPGFYLTKRIVDKFGIPVITMGIEERSNMKNESYKHGACFHITKPITIMKLDYIWKKVWINRPMRKRSKINEGASSLSRVENSKEVENTEKKLKLFHVASNFDKNSKVRLLWDSKLNERFQVAITLLDKDATPTNIIAIMNVQGLTTKHIASHLQKYRCKREREKKKREVQPSVVQLPTSPVHYQTNLAFKHQEESTGQYSPLMNNLSSAVESAPLHNQINLGFHIQDNIGRYNQQQNVNNLSNAMECGQLHNQMDLSFDYSSFKVPEPAPFMHSNHRLIEPLCNSNVNSTVVQPYIPAMNQNDNVANHQPLLYMDTNDEWNMDELLGSSNAFEAVQHQDASIMSSFHDADVNFNSSFNDYRNMNFDNDSFLEEMFGNAQVGGTD